MQYLSFQCHHLITTFIFHCDPNKILLYDSATVYIMLTYDEQINFTQVGISKRNLELLEQGKDNPSRS